MIKKLFILWNLVSRIDKLEKQNKQIDNRVQTIEAFFDNIEKISYDYRNNLDN